MNLTRLRFESRASAPDRCEQCDDERATHPRFCDRCAGNGWLVRTSERFQNGEGVCPMGARWGIEWGREFHPLKWGFGIEIDAESECPSVAVRLGPWIFYVGREML